MNAEIWIVDRDNWTLTLNHITTITLSLTLILTLNLTIILNLTLDLTLNFKIKIFYLTNSGLCSLHCIF